MPVTLPNAKNTTLRRSIPRTADYSDQISTEQVGDYTELELDGAVLMVLA
jgi:hypothetical protein